MFLGTVIGCCALGITALCLYVKWHQYDMPTRQPTVANSHPMQIEQDRDEHFSGGQLTLSESSHISATQEMAPPPEPDKSAPANVTESQLPSLFPFPWKVVAITVSGAAARAGIVDVTSQESWTLSVGDQLNGLTLAAVDFDAETVTFESTDESWKLALSGTDHIQDDVLLANMPSTQEAHDTPRDVETLVPRGVSVSAADLSSNDFAFICAGGVIEVPNDSERGDFLLEAPLQSVQQPIQDSRSFMGLEADDLSKEGVAFLRGGGVILPDASDAPETRQTMTVLRPEDTVSSSFQLNSEMATFLANGGVFLVQGTP